MTKLKPDISLILCTYGRTKEVDDFIQHATKFTIQNFEIIIADQNEDDRITKILNQYNNLNFSIKHLHTQKGLSRSRNQSLPHAEGNIVAFPDDDCIYAPDTLEKVIKFFNNHLDFQILIAKWANTSKEGYQPHADKISHSVTNFKEIFSFMSSEIFIRNSFVEKIGNFDEQIGLGSGTIFKGGEDYDFLLRALNKNLKIYYSADILIYHPWKGIDKNSSEQRIKNYWNDLIYAGASDFYVLKKNIKTLQLLKIILNNILASFYYLLIFNKIQFKNHLCRIKGFWLGFKYLSCNQKKAK